MSTVKKFLGSVVCVFVLGAIPLGVMQPTFAADGTTNPPPPPPPPNSTEVAISALPAAVVAAVNTALPSALLERAFTSTKDGQLIYQVDAKLEMMIYHLFITTEGKVLSYFISGQQIIPIGSLPEAVVTAINTAVPGLTLLNATKNIIGTMTNYGVQAQGPAGMYFFLVGSDGKIIEQKQNIHEEINPADLPAAVLATVQANAPGATIKRAVKNSDGTHVAYDIYAESETARYGFAIDADGTILRTFLETKTDIATLPQVVLDAIHSIAPDLKIHSAQKIIAGDKTAYNVFGNDQTSRYNFNVTAEGQILKYIQFTRIAITDLPELVASAAKSAVSGGTITDAEKVSQSGVLSYIVALTLEGKITRVVIGADGIVKDACRSEQDVKISDLPEVVTAALNKAYPSCTIDLAKLVSDGKRNVYVVDITLSNSKKLRVGVNSEGVILKVNPFLPPPPPKPNGEDNGSGNEKEKPSKPESVEVTALPQAVLDAVTTAVPDGTIVNAVKATTKKNGVVYKIETITETQDIYLTVTESGTVLQKVTKKLKVKKVKE